MINNILKILGFLLIVIFILCSGYLYTDKPALEFAEIDYTYPVKYSTSSPRIAYIDVGNGEVVLLIHGLASNAGFWRYNIGELSKQFRIIAIDLPGYGKSEKDDYSYKMTFLHQQ